MEYESFKDFLNRNDLKLKEFSKKSNISYSGCNKWKYTEIPPWVKSWCDLYEENKKLQKIKEIALTIKDNNF